MGTETYVKICGLRSQATVAAAVDAGASAVGFVLAPGSPRTTDPATISELVTMVPSVVDTVAVFRDQPIDEVLRLATEAGVTTVQLHGTEPDTDFGRLEAAGFATIRALGIEHYAARHALDPAALTYQRLLIDAPTPGAGVTFDATELSGIRPRGFWLLAGGLHPGNVADAIRMLCPSGVDVSSGVESTRGVKDVLLIRGFIEAARTAGTQPRS